MNAPETEEAAVKIQAAFRGHQVRKEMSDEKNAVSVPSFFRSIYIRGSGTELGCKL